MSPKSLDAMDEGIAGDSRMEVRVDEDVVEPAYTAGALPGQGSLLAPLSQPDQSADVMPTVFRVTEAQLDSAARVSGETSSRAGSRNESDAPRLSAPLLREHELGRDQDDRRSNPEPGLMRTPRNLFTRPSPSLSSMERGRPSARCRTAATRESSGGDPRMDQLAFLMESMMSRMDRLEGSERSSRRSGTSHGRSVRDYGGTGEYGKERDRVDPNLFARNPGLPVFPQGPCMHSQAQVGSTPVLGHYTVPHASQVLQPSRDAPASLLAGRQTSPGPPLSYAVSVPGPHVPQASQAVGSFHPAEARAAYAKFSGCLLPTGSGSSGSTIYRLNAHTGQKGSDSSDGTSV